MKSLGPIRAMNKLIDTIATRAIDVLDASGNPLKTVMVFIGRPEQEATGEWGCPFQIDGLGSGRPFRGFGLDAIQAIQGAMVVIGGTLAGTTEAEEGRLRWAGDKDLGFPIPPDPPKEEP